MVRSMFVPFLCGLAMVVASCGPVTSTTTGTVNVTVTVDKSANNAATDPTINVTITNTNGVVGDPITAAGAAPARTLNEGAYTVVAAAASGYNISITPSANITVAAAAPVSVTVTYVAQATSGAVNPSKTFTSSIGIGSLAFLTSAGTGQGRLYASGNATTNGNPSGRLFLEPADLATAGITVPAGQLDAQANLLEIVFGSGGTLYEMARDNTATITRYPRSTHTAAVGRFSPLDFVITTGNFTSGGGPDYSLLAPTDMVVDGSGNLWVVDPTSKARAADQGLPSTTPDGRLVCYSAAAQTAPTLPASPNNRIGTPGVVYYGASVAGARTLAIVGTDLWIGSGTGSSARIVKIPLSGLTCPNKGRGPAPGFFENGPDVLAAPAASVTLSGANLVGPVDLIISGSNVLVAQSNGSTNNILTIASNATALPAGAPITINGLVGSITSLAVDTGGKTWVGTAGTNTGRIYQLP